MAVDPQQRGRGHASTLLESLIADVGPTDPGWVCLQTNAADWNEPVRALYRRHGFVVAGEKIYDDRRDVIMRRAIWPAAQRVFTRAEAQGLSGLSPRETADWARAGVVAASRADSGRGLTFTGHEVLVLCVIARLRAAGVDFSTIREIAGSVAGRSTVTVGDVVVDCDAERDRIGR